MRFVSFLRSDGTLRPTLAHVRSFAVDGCQACLLSRSRHKGCTRLYDRCLQATEQYRCCDDMLVSIDFLVNSSKCS